MVFVRNTAFLICMFFLVFSFGIYSEAQFVPQNGIAVGEPYGMNPQMGPLLPPPMGMSPMGMPPMGMYNPLMAIPAPAYNYNTSPFNYSPFSYTPNYNYNLTPQFNYTPYDFSAPTFNPFNSYDSDYSYRSRDRYDDEDAEEREERREELEERREQRRREREEERRAERREREREREEPNNWPPVPRSSEQAGEVERALLPTQTPGAASTQQQQPARAADGGARASDGPAPQGGRPAPGRPGATGGLPAASQQGPWYATDPEAQRILRGRPAPGRPGGSQDREWPPRPRPVVRQTPAPAASQAPAPAQAPAPERQIETTTGPLAASAHQTTCATCTPTPGPLTQQVQQLAELADPREVFIYNKPPPTRISEGIRRVINTIYQSCDAYSILVRPDYCQEGYIGTTYCHRTQTRRAGDLTAYENPAEFFSHDIASRPGSNVMIPPRPEGPQCRDMLRTPPVFKFGGRPVIGRDAQGRTTLNLFNDSASRRFVTLDCTGFVTAALTAAGLNLYPNEDGRTRQLTTRELRGNATCLREVTFNANSSIQSGDVAVFAGESAHSMMFDRVGEDPFGLRSMPSLPSGANADTHCRNNLRVSQFDFVIAQSGVYGGRMAVSQSRAVDYIVNFGNGMQDGINAQIIQIATDACVAKLTGVNRSVGRADGARLMRHKGTSAPGCVRSSPPVIRGQECVRGCT